MKIEDFAFAFTIFSRSLWVICGLAALYPISRLIGGHREMDDILGLLLCIAIPVGFHFILPRAIGHANKYRPPDAH